jgi:hypothetical protein
MYFFTLVAAAAACYFAVAAIRQPRAGVIVAAIVWLAYAAYEVLIANGTLCDANCNIRVDLILLWPLIWIATLFGIYAPGQWPTAAKVLVKVSFALLAAMVAVSLYIVLVETPAANRAAQQQNCAGPNESDCPPAAPPATSAP